MRCLLLAASASGLLALPAAAAMVGASQATLRWAPASGAPSGYGVWISWNGLPTAAQPDVTVNTTEVVVAGDPGESFTMRVAAFYPDGQQGPFSADSDPIQFDEPSKVPYDFDGNGTCDTAVRSKRTNEHPAFLIDAQGVVDFATLPAAPDPDWRIAGSGDFDRDGRSDILWSHEASGGAATWQMNGLGVAESTPIGTLGPGWYAHAMGDHEPDGAARVLWRNGTTGEARLWEVRDNAANTEHALAPMDPRFYVWAACDLDGNGFRDLVWNSDAFELRAWLMHGGGQLDEVVLPHKGARWNLRGCGDFDRSGRDALVWQPSSKDGQVELWELSAVDAQGNAAGASSSLTVRRNWVVAAAGDQDGDGDADISLLNPRRGKLRVVLLEGRVPVAEHIVDLGAAKQGDRWELATW